MAEPFDPYHKWLGIRPHDRPISYYRLLGLRFGEDDPEVIGAAADRQMSFVRTLQCGKHAAESQQLLNELATARLILLNPEKRERYNQQFLQQTASPQVPQPPPSLPATDSGPIHSGPIHSGPIHSGSIHSGSIHSGPMASGSPAAVHPRLHSQVPSNHSTSGDLRSGYPGSGYPGSGYPGSGYLGSGYLGSGASIVPPGVPLFARPSQVESAHAVNASETAAAGETVTREEQTALPLPEEGQLPRVGEVGQYAEAKIARGVRPAGFPLWATVSALTTAIVAAGLVLLAAFPTRSLESTADRKQANSDSARSRNPTASNKDPATHSSNSRLNKKLPPAVDQSQVQPTNLNLSRNQPSPDHPKLSRVPASQTKPSHTKPSHTKPSHTKPGRKVPNTDGPIEQGWDYAGPMKEVALRFQGRPGVVLHIGDSMTYASPYGRWACRGLGRLREDKQVGRWMHVGDKDEHDGWYLAAEDAHTGRSFTAASALQAQHLLHKRAGQLPPLRELLQTYQPQMIVLMVGTFDAKAQRPVDEFAADINTLVQETLEQGAICILSTIPPYPPEEQFSHDYNQAIREVGRRHGLPLIDLEQEILLRRPDDWSGTLVNPKNGFLSDKVTLPNGKQVQSRSAPTAENLKNVGYLLRGWLSLRKIAEVKQRVLQ